MSLKDELLIFLDGSEAYVRNALANAPPRRIIDVWFPDYVAAGRDIEEMELIISGWQRSIERGERPYW